jgi:hypothetical protein
VCGKIGIIHFHHCSYDRIGDEQPGDLVVLCGPHHRAVHNLIKHYKIALLKAHIALKEEWVLEKRGKKKISKNLKKKLSEDKKARSKKRSKEQKLSNKKRQKQLQIKKFCSCERSSRGMSNRKGSCFKCGKPRQKKSELTPQNRA